MAVKSGASHSLATLLLAIISALLIHYLKHVGIFENIFGSLHKLSFRFSAWLNKSFNIEITHELFPIIFVAALLAFVWGVIFHLTRD